MIIRLKMMIKRWLMKLYITLSWIWMLSKLTCICWSMFFSWTRNSLASLALSETPFRAWEIWHCRDTQRENTFNNSSKRTVSYKPYIIKIQFQSWLKIWNSLSVIWWFNFFSLQVTKEEEYECKNFIVHKCKCLQFHH